MKYFSEKTKEFYTTEKECLEAEFKAKEEENRQRILKEREAARQKEEREKAAAERKAAAEKVDAARKAMVEAQNAYKKELEAFIAKYKTYHFSTDNIKEIPNLFDVFDIPRFLNLL